MNIIYSVYRSCSFERKIVGPEKGRFFFLLSEQLKLFLHEFYVLAVYLLA